MSNIAFSIWPLVGCINASLKLAKTLRERGHRVCYIGIPDCEAQLRPNGLEFVPVFESAFPKDLLLTLETRARSLHGVALLREMRARTKGYRAHIERLLTGENQELQRALEAVNPDLLIVDSSTPYSIIAGLFAHSLGVPVAYLSTTLNHHVDPESPPFSSSLIPRPGRASRLKVRLAWGKALLRKYAAEYGYSALGLDVDMHGLVRRLAARCGFPARQIKRSTALAPFLRIPEFYATAREFEFPTSGLDGRHYLGLTLDLERSEPPFPWESLSPDKPLIYCSLGSLLYLGADEHRKFLQRVVEAVRRRTDWQLVLATGAYVRPEELKDVPPHVLVAGRVPQLKLLERSTLMITHGGTNTVNECIYFGVPMVVFPLGFDQYGEAARVVYHGLGVRGDARRASPGEILEMTETVFGDPSFRARTAAMSETIRGGDGFERGVEAIERLARTRAA